jgi:hypothetical protein
MDKVGTTGVGVGVAVGGGTGVGIDDGDGAGVGSTGLKTGFRSRFGAAFTATPLFQTSFVPDLMQVNFFPPETEVDPAFVHLAPALTAANDGTVMRDIDSKRARNKRERVMR